MARGIHGGGGAFRHPALYELTAAVIFRGRRRRMYDDLIRLAGITAGDRVLDVGCGPGYLSRRVARVVGPSGRIEGIDPSPETIAYATRRAPTNAAFTVAAAESLPQPDDAFDVVMSSLALHHIEPGQRADALREMRRVVRPDGRLLVLDFGGSHGHASKGPLGRIGHHAAERPAVADLTTLITEAGFVVADQGDRPHGMCFILATPEAATTGDLRTS
jgi:ubiquinone/menaquinone biosynthesis C-methylase UbiE